MAILPNLPTSVALPLGELFERQELAAGKCVFREGQVVDSVYFIASGEVALEMDVPGRGRQRILTLGPGDLLGWSPVLGSAGMSATAVVLQAAELYVAAGSALRELCAANTEVGYYLMREVASSLGRRLIATRLQLLDLFGTGDSGL